MTAYGATLTHRSAYIPTQTDRRYRNQRWKRTRLLVLDRDRHCYVVNCPELANVADHINPVYPGMPDSEFYSLTNLRASCKRHNTARGVAARLQREVEAGVAPEPSRYSVGGRGGFLGSPSAHDRPLANLHTQSRSAVITADYSRREVVRGVG